MKIAIISDIHNNTVNLKKVLDYCGRGKIGTIICCGDLASKDTLDFLCDNFSGTVHYTFGNMDEGQLRDVITWTFDVQVYKNVTLYKNFGELDVVAGPLLRSVPAATRKIAFVHFPDVAKKLCMTGKYDFVFYGHTHKPWSSEASAKETRGSKKCTMLNPGNVAGDIYPPTFAVWETENNKFELVRIHDLR